MKERIGGFLLDISDEWVLRRGFAKQSVTCHYQYHLKHGLDAFCFDAAHYTRARSQQKAYSHAVCFRIYGTDVRFWFAMMHLTFMEDKTLCILSSQMESNEVIRQVPQGTWLCTILSMLPMPVGQYAQLSRAVHI